MSFTKNIFTLCSVVCIAAALGACGGGGNSDVVVKPGVALYTTAPDTVKLNSSASTSFNVGGGGNGANFTSYSASSDNSSVATASILSSVLTIQSGSSGTANVTVKDSTGAAVVIKIVVSGVGDFSIQAPPSVTLSMGLPVSYKINGGTQPYTVVSSNLGVASGGIVNNDSIMINPVTVGGAQIFVYDAKGGSTSITTNVAISGTPTALFTTSPSYISLAIDGKMPNYKIGGGTPPYTVNTNSPEIIEVIPSVAGDTFTVKAKAHGFGSVVVKDSVGVSVPIAVSIANGSSDAPLYTTSAPSITLKINNTSSFQVAGGSAPYAASSSDPSVASVVLSGSDLKISGIATGTASIVVKDKLGSVVSISANVPDPLALEVTTPLYTSAPGSVILVNGTTSTFNVAGGKAPYVATSSNQAVASPSIVNSTLSIKALTSGTGSIIVTDSIGTKINIAVTVSLDGAGTVSNMFTTAPPSLTLKNGVSNTYTITGGKAPYTVTSSAIAVATTSISGSSFTIAGVAAGTTSVVVLDANGTIVNISVSVSGTTGQVNTALFTTAPSAVTIKNGASATFTVSGGNGPYTITTSAAAVVTVNSVGSDFTLTGVGLGSATIAVVDAIGTLVAIGVTIN